MSNPDLDHLTRTDYNTVTGAVHDAAAIIGELLANMAECEGPFLEREHLEFLARRARQLTLNAFRAAYEEGV